MYFDSPFGPFLSRQIISLVRMMRLDKYGKQYGLNFSRALEEVTLPRRITRLRRMSKLSGDGPVLNKFNSHYNYQFLDLDPCTNVTCKYHSHCVASSPHQFTCVCENSCPSYEKQVCASNGRTFKNLCWLRREICRTRENYTKQHPGSCTGIFNVSA